MRKESREGGLIWPEWEFICHGKVGLELVIGIFGRARERGMDILIIS